MANIELDSIIDKFEELTKNPVNYLSVQEDVKEDIKILVKSIYDFTKRQEHSNKKENKGALKKLIVEGFDEEQVWQEIELQNSECWDDLVWQVADSMSKKGNLEFPVIFPKNNINDNERLDSSDGENVSTESENEFDEELKSNELGSLNTNKKYKSSIVDDEFFKLDEMEKFLVKEEKKLTKNVVSDSEEESVNMFEDTGDEESDVEDSGKVMYADFFSNQEQDLEHSTNVSTAKSDTASKDVNKISKKVTFAHISDASSDESIESNEDSVDKFTVKDRKDNRKKSDLELRNERLQQQIKKLEEKSLKESPWQLKGEVDATKRPQNSLLEEVVDFDLTTRPPPIITEETTRTLEDIIKQRVKDKSWDDVIKKQKPVEDQLSFRKPVVLDQSKSKLSLAQVYEAEYIKQKQRASGATEEEKEPEIHIEIRNSMTKLFTKLDALCHYHYTPKPPQAEVKIVTNTPVISMEEVAPVATSEAMLLAPEEIKKKNRGDLIGKEERTLTDRNRERRKKKKLQKRKAEVAIVDEHKKSRKGKKK